MAAPVDVSHIARLREAHPITGGAVRTAGEMGAMHSICCAAPSSFLKYDIGFQVDENAISWYAD
jgi:hypothetical protein